MAAPEVITMKRDDDDEELRAMAFRQQWTWKGFSLDEFPRELKDTIPSEAFMTLIKDLNTVYDEIGDTHGVLVTGKSNLWFVNCAFRQCQVKDHDGFNKFMFDKYGNDKTFLSLLAACAICELPSVIVCPCSPPVPCLVIPYIDKTINTYIKNDLDAANDKATELLTAFNKALEASGKTNVSVYLLKSPCYGETFNGNNSYPQEVANIVVAYVKPGSPVEQEDLLYYSKKRILADAKVQYDKDYAAAESLALQRKTLAAANAAARAAQTAAYRY